MTRDADPIAPAGCPAMMTGGWNRGREHFSTSQDLGMRRCDFIDILAARWQLEIATIHASLKASGNLSGENCDE
jgi:hypothetical protein